jgi:hypothetical protein
LHCRQVDAPRRVAGVHDGNGLRTLRSAGSGSDSNRTKQVLGVGKVGCNLLRLKPLSSLRWRLVRVLGLFGFRFGGREGFGGLVLRDPLGLGFLVRGRFGGLLCG